MFIVFLLYKNSKQEIMQIFVKEQMDTSVYRHVIKYLFFSKRTATELITQMSLLGTGKCTGFDCICMNL